MEDVAIKIDPNAWKEKQAKYSFTEGCEITVSEAGVLALTWDNGRALTAIDGGTQGYIAPHFKIHTRGNTYSFAHDFNTMTDKGVSEELAFIICLLRKAVLSKTDIVLNTVEEVKETADAGEIKVTGKIKAMLGDGAILISNILKQAFTILALNGISMIQKGHHWVSSDKMWSRFNTATNFDVAMTTFVGEGWESAIFHDCFHPIEIRWLSKEVATKTGVFMGKVQGVALKRLGTLPAGSTIVGVLKALCDDAMVHFPSMKDEFKRVMDVCSLQIRVIQQNPLDWCSTFQSSKTATNLAEIAKFEWLASFVHGMLKATAIKRTTAMAAKSLINISQRNSAAFQQGTIVGRAKAMSEDEAEETADEFVAIFSRMAFDASTSTTTSASSIPAATSTTQRTSPPLSVDTQAMDSALAELGTIARREEVDAEARRRQRDSTASSLFGGRASSTAPRRPGQSEEHL